MDNIENSNQPVKKVSTKQCKKCKEQINKNAKKWKKHLQFYKTRNIITFVLRNKRD